MQERWKAVNLEANTRWGVAGIQAQAAMDRTMKQIDARQKAIEQIKGTKPEQAAKLDAANAKNMQQQLTQAGQAIAAAEQNRKNASGEAKDGYDKTIQGLESQQKFATEWLKQYQERTNAKAGGTPLDTTPASEKGAEADASSNDGKRSAVPISVVGAQEEDTPDGDPTDPDSSYYNN